MVPSFAENWKLCFFFLFFFFSQGIPEFVFANRSGLEMFETATASSLKDLDWEKTLNENDRKLSYATFTHVLQQVFFLSIFH